MKDRNNITSIPVSVVIPTYNRRDLLRETIISLFIQSYPKDKYEIIVVDNSSTDGTGTMIEELQKDSPCNLKYFRKENKGPAAARNLGIRNASGEIIAFTDSDCTVHPDWIRNGARHFVENDIAFVSGQKLAKPNQPISFFSPFDEVTEEHPVYPTLNIFYRKDILVSLGGFDERFATINERPEGGEDAHLAWRVKRLGWKNVFAKDLIVYHEVFRLTMMDFLVRNSWRWRKIPLVIKEIPELREKSFFLWIFINRTRPFIYIFIFGILASIISSNKIFFLSGVPYLYISLRDVKHPHKHPSDIAKSLSKLFLNGLRDLISAFIYVYGSIRYRSLVL